MPSISRKVYKARKEYVCNECGECINKNEHHVYAFGSENGKSYRIRVCLKCELEEIK